MSSYIVIGASVLLSLIVVHLVVKRFNLLQPFKKGGDSTALFLSNEEALKLISQKAELNEEEKEHLSVLFTLISGNRLHHGFEDKEVTNRWLISARRAIVNASFDANYKEELEYSVYEIYRKINNIRMITHPSVRFISDLNVGQPITVTFMNRATATGELLDYNFYSYTVKVNITDATMIPKHLEKKNIFISLWKIMDAQYSFHSKVTAVEKKGKELILICGHPKTIECTKIRSYPRQDVEIPVKFRQATVAFDSDTGGMSESFGDILFGVINNIGPWGCSLISYVPIPIHTILMIDIPLFKEFIKVKGTIKNLSKRGDVYFFNIEFSVETSKANTLIIYHYLFAEDSSR